MWIRLIGLALKLVLLVAGYLERQKWKAEGRREAHAEADELRKERIAQANAARADADELDGLHDPWNRDNRN